MCKKSNRSFMTFMLPTLIVLLIVLAVPMVYSLAVSFFDTNLKHQGIGNFVGLKNYISALTDKYFVSSAWTTLIFTIGVVIFEFLLGLGIALLLNTNVRGKSIYFSIIIIPMMITPVAVGLTWRLLLHSELGIVNYVLGLLGLSGKAWLAESKLALPTVMFIDIWQNVSYMVLVLQAGLVSLPLEPYEAVKVDGASSLQSFRYLTIPMMMPTFMTVLLMRAISALKTYDLIYVLTKGGPGVSTEVISYHIYQEAFRNLELGSASAMSYLLVLVIIPIAICFIKISKNKNS